ncbi:MULTISPECIES: enoyl-CoA hydratase/isomerase family protein [unclassified Leifsonia]|uniref:enoyl-CoA hydratase/isomerase family protein n=1 Tax=unclassified Leifsonia TaxID=2663824 RepID=UPI0009E9C8F9|nr:MULTISPECIES: enoyl-CoA hydratase/isomerase family protein [unclassified Leifsonia]
MTETTSQTPSEPQTEPEVLTSVTDGVGRITLNRPRAINALSYAMVGIITASLEVWRSDPEVAMVVLDGAGDRGFCAGGDVRALWDNATAGSNADSRTFFRDEYRLNAMIARYPKPVVALMDGITMGGGIGLAGHASIRIVTERSTLAMPETRIGFSPDVGGTWLLGRAPGELGTHLGLTAATMGPADAIAAGFADYLVPSESLPHLMQALRERADPGSPPEIVLLFDETPGASELEAQRGWIDACYSAPTVADIIHRLRERPEPEAARAADDLSTLSPTGLTATLAGIRSARAASNLEQALESEYRAVAWLIEQPDLREGIRAQVVDKDRSPRWNPATIDDIDTDAVLAAIAQDPAEPLWS